MKIEVRLFATLRRYLPEQADGTKTTLEMAEGSRVCDVIEQLGIPVGLAGLVMVDGVHEQDRERVLVEDQVVNIFPPVAGG